MSDSENKPLVTTTKGGRVAVVQMNQPKVSTSTGNVKQSGGGNQVDIVVVFDTTGSMDNKIVGLLQTCRQFVDEAKSFDLTPQFGLISFGDISVQGGGDSIDLVVPLTPDIARMQAGLAQIPRNNGFGNWGESCLEALDEAIKLTYRPKAVKVLVLITDEPAHQERITATEMTKRLKAKEFLVFVVATEDQYYKDMARETGGIWKLISPTTDLSELLKLFRDLARKVSKIAKDVHHIGDGSVKKYLALKPPNEK